MYTINDLALFLAIFYVIINVLFLKFGNFLNFINGIAQKNLQFQRLQRNFFIPYLFVLFAENIQVIFIFLII